MVRLHDIAFIPLITPEEVQQRVQELGAELNKRYADSNPLFIGILNGAFVFAADLVRTFEGDCEISFVKLASYSGTRSAGDVRQLLGLDKSVEGRHVVIVEDILDTGRTLHFLANDLLAQNPASISIAAFLRKPSAAQFPVKADFIGFDIEDRFVVGYGLDYDGLGRNLPGVYVLEEGQ
jgi:hypoxanthine phosphoribosyltransferase